MNRNVNRCYFQSFNVPYFEVVCFSPSKRSSTTCVECKGSNGGSALHKFIKKFVRNRGGLINEQVFREHFIT